MLKNVIKSDSFFYHDFINSRQSQDRQGFALKAASRKNKQIIFKIMLWIPRWHINTRFYRKNAKFGLRLKHRPNLGIDQLRTEFF